MGVQASQPGMEAVSVTPFVSSAYPNLGGAIGVNKGLDTLQFTAKYNESGSYSLYLFLETC